MLSGEDRVSESEELTPVQKSMLPPRAACLGCKTYFIQSEKLQLEDIKVQFKNYNQIPLKEEKHKFIVLKTITAFLNTKGGAIYMGVQDDKCEVIGNLISKSGQKEFVTFVTQLCKQIYPPVNAEDVKTFFIPILKRNGTFTGRYITKIFVKQGKVDTLYTFAQKVKLITQKVGEGEQFQIRMGFLRIGPGGLEKLDGLKMYEQVFRRGKQNNDVCEVHPGCNPHPHEIVLEIKIISFRVPKEKQFQISNFVVKLTQHLGRLDYKEHYDESNSQMIIEFDSAVVTEAVRDAVELEQRGILNDNSQLKYLGIQKNMFIFGPALKQIPKSERKQKQKVRQQKKQQKPVRQQQSKRIRASEPPLEKSPKLSAINYPIYYIFTHINIKLREQFIEFLNSKLPRRLKYVKFTNSVSCKLSTPQQLEAVRNSVSKIQKQLHLYGHGYRTVYGRCTGHIHIYNYFDKEKQKLKDMIMNKFLKGKVKKFNFRPDNSDSKRTFIDIELDEKDAPEALDILLQSQQIRMFKIFNKDSRKDNAYTPKMKFMLQCD